MGSVITASMEAVGNALSRMRALPWKTLFVQ
jgi:hypothetical protein